MRKRIGVTLLDESLRPWVRVNKSPRTDRAGNGCLSKEPPTVERRVPLTSCHCCPVSHREMVAVCDGRRSRPTKRLDSHGRHAGMVRCQIWGEVYRIVYCTESMRPAMESLADLLPA